MGVGGGRREREGRGLERDCLLQPEDIRMLRNKREGKGDERQKVMLPSFLNYQGMSLITVLHL